MKFQSAPLTEARGDLKKGISTMVHGVSFNPLPLPKQGEIFARAGVYDPCALFQSAPLTEARGDGKEGTGTNPGSACPQFLMKRNYLAEHS